MVTGGCGFIGSHLVDSLVEMNHDVVVIDDCSANNDQFYFNSKATYHKIDVCDTIKVAQLVDGCDYIFHLAAESRLQNSIINPKRAIEVNIGGTLSVLEACRHNKVKGLIFSSTSSIYGLPTSFPITENFSENCLNPYASTKYAAELLIRNYNELHGVKSCILRYFNVFGERAPTKGPYALVTGIFSRQKKNNEPLTVVGNGKQKRDFIYVKDVVAANIACMQNWNDSVNSACVFNVGSGQEIEVLDLAKTISDRYVFIESRKGEAENNLCSHAKLTTCTNWNPTVNILNWIKNVNIF